jgi:hypothetical protein
MTGDGDLGYLISARALVGTYRSHNNVAALVRQMEAIVEKVDRPIINIVGHGQPGLVGAGCGNSIAGPEFYLAGDLSDYFAPIHGKVEAIIFWGCDIGAERPGAEFLQDMARGTRALCMAQTGLVCCCPDRGFFLPEKTPWQVALPYGKDVECPQLIKRPPRHRDKGRPVSLIGDDGTPVDASCLESAEFDEGGSSDLARKIIIQAESDSTLDTQCKLGAFVTRKICARFDKIATARKFNILNHRILEDVHSGQYYFLSPEITEALL